MSPNKDRRHFSISSSSHLIVGELLLRKLMSCWCQIVSVYKDNKPGEESFPLVPTLSQRGDPQSPIKCTCSRPVRILFKREGIGKLGEKLKIVLKNRRTKIMLFQLSVNEDQQTNCNNALN